MVDKTNIALLYELLQPLKETTQDLRYHPEGNVFEHSIQCFKAACRDTSDIDLIIAALMHDVGKQENSLGHDKIGVNILADHCTAKTLLLVEQHMRFKAYLSGEMRKKQKIFYFHNHPWLPEMVALNRFDNAARKPIQTRITLDDIYSILARKADAHFTHRKDHEGEE